MVHGGCECRRKRRQNPPKTAAKVPGHRVTVVNLLVDALFIYWSWSYTSRTWKMMMHVVEIHVAVTCVCL